MKRKILIEIIAFMFILLFLYAGFSKLIDYQKFSVRIGQSPVLTGFGNTIPWLIIGSELVVSVLLFMARFRLFGFFMALSLMVMFTTYIIIILNFSSFVPCSCGGILEGMGWVEHLIFNLAFTALAIVGISLQAMEESLVVSKSSIA